MTFTQDRSDAIRDGLVAAVRKPRLRPVVRRRLAGAALLAGGLLVGGAVSAAAVTIAREPVIISGTGLQAPPGVLPGQPVISLLGAVTTTPVTGSLTIPLPPAPVGATHLRVSLTCVTAGMVSWGFDATGNNPSTGCDGPSGDGGWMDFALDNGTTVFYVTAREEVDSIVTFQYLNYVETEWGVNSRGETYGVVKDGRPDPDLQAVWIADAQGTGIGYVRSEALHAFSPDRPSLPSNPDEALAWQAERDDTYPNGWDIPVYDSEGTTQLGVFHVA